MTLITKQKSLIVFNKKDFDEALFNVKPSINEKSIEQYVEWNKNFGSFQFEDKDE